MSEWGKWRVIPASGGLEVDALLLRQQGDAAVCDRLKGQVLIGPVSRLPGISGCNGQAT